MSEARRAVLALDQGSHASRACIVGPDRTVLAEAQVPIRTVHGADEIVASLQSAARAAAAAARGRDSELVIAAAGLATQRSTLVCFDRSRGTALSAAISWQDRRNAAWLAAYGPHAERVRALTGPVPAAGLQRHLRALRNAAARRAVRRRCWPAYWGSRRARPDIAWKAR